MRIPGILNSSGFLLFTLLIAFTALYIYFTINSNLRSIGVNSPLDYCVSITNPQRNGLQLEEGKVLFQKSFVVLAGRGDNITADVIPPSSLWGYSLLVVDAVTNEVIVNYTNVYRTIRPLLPVFISPRSTLYYITVRAESAIPREPEKACLQYSIAIYPTTRVDAVATILAFTAILALILVFIALFKPRIRYSGLLGELVINAKFMWLWFFTPLCFLIVYSTLLDLSPRINYAHLVFQDKLMALDNYRELLDIDFLAVYGVSSSILYTILFTYRREIGEEKLRDTLPYHRWGRYVSLILTHFSLMYLPLLIVSILHLFELIPHIAIADPYLFFKYLYHLVTVTLFIYAVTSIIPLIVSILAPRTSISMAVSIVLYLLLLYDTPIARLTLNWIPICRGRSQLEVLTPSGCSIGGYVREIMGIYISNPENVGEWFIEWEGGLIGLIYFVIAPILIYVGLLAPLFLLYLNREYT